jgi:hypothetical protein
MAASIAEGTDVWVVVPASPPLRLTIRACLDDGCCECDADESLSLGRGLWSD